MKPWRAFTTISVLVLAAMAAPASAGAAAEQAMAAIERSGYSVEERAALRQEASRALEAGVPAEDLAVIVLRGSERGAPAATVRGLMGTATHTLERNLPVRPVLDRIEQGLAKGAPVELISAASLRLVENLAAAGPLVDRLAKDGLPSVSPGDRAYAVEAVARARERSIPDAVVLEMGAAVRTQSGSMALFDRTVRSLTFLASSGMPLDAASGVVNEAIDHRFTEKDYARLERRLSEMLRQGERMDDVLSAADREIRQGRESGGRNSGMRDRGSGMEPGGRGGKGR